MLNKDTRELLKNLIPINNSMIIGPTQTGCDEFKSVIFKTELSKIDPDIQEFGVFDTSVFLQAMDLLDDPVISLKDNIIKASDKDTEIEYITSTISSLDYVQIDEEIIDTTVQALSITEFDFNTDVLSKIKKAKSVFKNFDTLFINKDTNIEISIGNENTFSKSNNSWSLTLDPIKDTGKKYTIALPLDSIMKLPSMPYTCMIKYNESRDVYRVVLQNELITFVLSLKS